MFCVYILQCHDKSYYTGHTDNLENRLIQHQHKIISGCYTSTRLPVQLIYSQRFSTREDALPAEKQYKACPELVEGMESKKKRGLD